MDDKLETLSNVGTGDGIALAKVGTDVPLKSLVAGTGITLVNNPNDITISSAVGSSGSTNLTFIHVNYPIQYASAVTHTITELSASLTPSSVNSKIEILYFINHEAHYNGVFLLHRNGVEIGSAPPSGLRNAGFAAVAYDGNVASTISPQTFHYIDSPNTTTPVTYDILVRYNQARVLNINRTFSSPDSSLYELATSSVMLREII